MKWKTCVDLIRKNTPDVIAIYLFGSFAKGEETTHSDVDLAVLLPHPIEVQTRFKIQEKLSILVQRDVDLVFLFEASPILAMQVLKNGKILDVSNEHEHQLYSTKTMCMYQDFKFFRARMEQDLLNRLGKYHG